ncbi:MAG TPA: hypothetical protein VFY24_15405 [Azospira sp.]|nr:hypothetical protein [Azospira sp.]
MVLTAPPGVCSRRHKAPAAELLPDFLPDSLPDSLPASPPVVAFLQSPPEPFGQAMCTGEQTSRCPASTLVRAD